MAKPFKFFADFSDISRALIAQEKLNKSLDTSQKLAKKSALEHERIAKATERTAKAQKAEALRPTAQILQSKAIGNAMEGHGISANIFGAMSKIEQMTGLISKGFQVAAVAASLFGKALLAIGNLTWIGVLTTAIFIFKRVWDANIGGVQTVFSKVMGKVLDVFGRVTAAFYAFVEKVGPMFSGFFEGIANLLIPIIDGVGKVVLAFLASGDAVDQIGNTFQPIFQGITKVIKTVIGILGRLGKDIFSTADNGTSAFGNLFETLGMVLGAFLDALDAVLKFNEAIGTFKLLGFIFKVIGYALQGIGVILILLFKGVELLAGSMVSAFKAIGDWIQPVIGWLEKAWKIAVAVAKIIGADLFGSDADKKKARDDAIQTVKDVSATAEESAAKQTVNQRTTTINNSPTVTVNSSGAITPENAPMIGDTLARSVMVQRGVM